MGLNFYGILYINIEESKTKISILHVVNRRRDVYVNLSPTRKITSDGNLGTLWDKKESQLYL